MELVKNRIHMANRLGTDVIVLHTPKQLDEGFKIIATWEAVHRSLDNLIPYARERSVRIAFENLNHPSNHTTLEKILAAYEPSDVGICYDPGHGNQEVDGLDFADRVKERLIAFHLNDNDSSSDQHNHLFTATVDWRRLAQIIGASSYNKKYMTMEVDMRDSGFNDEAEFLAKAMESGVKFHKMVTDARR